MNYLFFNLVKLIILLNFSISILYAEIDYKSANINRKKYYQVPQNELIFGKLQANEPAFFFEGPKKGHGYQEPLENYYIQKVRNSGISVYVDYFTESKVMLYVSNPNYEICVLYGGPFSHYKNVIKKSMESKFVYDSKFRMQSIPVHLEPTRGRFAIKTSKLPLIKKYLYPGTQIYNVESIANDDQLKTIMITGAGSGFGPYFYDNFWKAESRTLKPGLKKRVYEFVASNSIQFILMLQGNRMDYAEVEAPIDFYKQKLKISDNEIVILNYSDKHPNLMTKDDLNIRYYNCFSKDLNKLKKVISIINSNAKNIRSNEAFWNEVLSNYAKDFDLPYTSPRDFYYTKEVFKNKKEFDAGFFD